MSGDLKTVGDMSERLASCLCRCACMCVFLSVLIDVMSLRKHYQVDIIASICEMIITEHVCQF